MKKIYFFPFFFLLSFLSLAGCGKKAIPTYPNPSQEAFPRTYPAGACVD